MGIVERTRQRDPDGILGFFSIVLRDEQGDKRLALPYFFRKSFQNKVPLQKSAFLHISIENPSKKSGNLQHLSASCMFVIWNVEIWFSIDLPTESHQGNKHNSRDTLSRWWSVASHLWSFLVCVCRGGAVSHSVTDRPMTLDGDF